MNTIPEVPSSGPITVERQAVLSSVAWYDPSNDNWGNAGEPSGEHIFSAYWQANSEEDAMTTASMHHFFNKMCLEQWLLNHKNPLNDRDLQNILKTRFSKAPG